MIRLSDYISGVFPSLSSLEPWTACTQSNAIISSLFDQLPNEYVISEGNAVHPSAIVEAGAVLKPPVIIGPDCFVAAYAYLRGGVWLDSHVIIGPSCEIKSSFIFSGSKAAHFNFIGDSIIGRNVNIEAGAIIANYRNEWEDREIKCMTDNGIIKTGVNKFGSLLGDACKIGANAVLAPGTLLKPRLTVKRLALIDQIS